jgi:alcohol dehydrogenase class IV
MLSRLAGSEIVIAPTPVAHFGAGAAGKLPGLADRLGMTQRLADLGINPPDFDQIAADALDDEVLASTPRPPAAADIRSILLAC